MHTEIFIKLPPRKSIFAFSYLPGWIDMCYSSYFTALASSILTIFLDKSVDKSSQIY